MSPRTSICHQCGKASRHLRRGDHPDIPIMVWHTPGWYRNWNYCPACLDQLIAPFRQACTTCDLPALLNNKGQCQQCSAQALLARRRLRIRLRHARKRARGEVSASEWQALCAYFGNVCLCCGQAVSLTMDHVVPIAKDGTNTIDNIQPLGKSCNSKKATKIIDYRDPLALADFLEALHARA